MALHFGPPDDPRQEWVLWRMRKAECYAEARMGIVPLGHGLPEFRIYMTGTDGTFALIASVLLSSEADVRTRAAHEQRTFEVHGWRLDVTEPQPPTGQADVERDGPAV